MVTCTAVSLGRKYPGYSDDTVVQDSDAEGETDECIDSETDEDFFKTEFDECPALVVTFFTVSKASLQLLCSSFKRLAFFICKADENVGQPSVMYTCAENNLSKYATDSLFENKNTFSYEGLVLGLVLKQKSRKAYKFEGTCRV